jgi:uncharacterized protein (UPF0303 family)
MRKKFYHFYYSGMDGYDFDRDWLTRKKISVLRMSISKRRMGKAARCPRGGSMNNKQVVMTVAA